MLFVKYVFVFSFFKFISFVIVEKLVIGLKVIFNLIRFVKDVSVLILFILLL